MENTSQSSYRSIIIAILWIITLGAAGLIGYQIGKNGGQQVESVAATQQVPVVLGSGQTVSSTPSLSGICSKSGASLKSEFLRTYIIKDGDSLQSIAEKELGSLTRVSELITLNDGAQNLTAGSTLYLPPEHIANSTGKLAQVSGMIVQLDNAIWQISYGGGKEGLGIAIPTYYFANVTNKNEFKLGDCVTIFLEDGVKVYTVARQE